MSKSFVFWQNIISIHQTAFLKSLSVRCGVTLIAEFPLSAARAESGWKIPEMGRVEIIAYPSPEEVDRILDCHREAIHIFSGIDAYPLVYNAFRKATRKRMNVFVYAEPYNSTGLLGKLKHLKYRFLHLKYGRRITALLATGELGKRCYRRAGFKRVFEWGYFTEDRRSATSEKQEKNASEKPVLLYVGQLVKRKKIVEFVRVATRMAELFDHFYIVGQGSLLPEVEKAMAATPNITYLGVVQNEDMAEIMSRTDLLVLPSQFDGWGAVVNEALQCGTRVLCSDACGAATLLDHEQRGGTFRWGRTGEPATVLRRWLEMGPVPPETRHEIALWARTHISGEAACAYFLELCNCNESGQAAVPLPPWKTHETEK